MERIKKRLEKALNHLMLAENEINRLKIMKKPIILDEQEMNILTEMRALADKIGRASVSQE